MSQFIYGGQIYTENKNINFKETNGSIFHGLYKWTCSWSNKMDIPEEYFPEWKNLAKTEV